MQIGFVAFDETDLRRHRSQLALIFNTMHWRNA